MANVVVTPTTMSLNGYGIGISTAYSTSAVFTPTTASVYQVKIPEDGKVGMLLKWVGASSSAYVRVQVAMSASSDYLGWQKYPMSTDVVTFYSGPTVAASSTEYLFMGPFESAKVGRLSTAGYKVMNVTVDAAGSQVSGSTLSTTFALPFATGHMIVFQMP
jgi:hypothetical protein